MLAELFDKGLADAFELELGLGLVLSRLAELGFLLKAGSLEGLGTVLIPLLEVLQLLLSAFQIAGQSLALSLHVKVGMLLEDMLYVVKGVLCVVLKLLLSLLRPGPAHAQALLELREIAFGYHFKLLALPQALLIAIEGSVKALRVPLELKLALLPLLAHPLFLLQAHRLQMLEVLFLPLDCVVLHLVFQLLPLF